MRFVYARHIVAGVDGSPGSVTALRVATGSPSRGPREAKSVSTLRRVGAVEAARIVVLVMQDPRDAVFTVADNLITQPEFRSL
jgi:hypothetical protein